MDKSVYVSFYSTDRGYADELKSEAAKHNFRVSFDSMFTKQPWDEAWQKKAKEKIDNASGLVAIMTSHSHNAAEMKFELDYAISKGIPVIGIYSSDTEKNKITLPASLSGRKSVEWKWNNMEIFYNSL